jgi:hypothetical protein
VSELWAAFIAAQCVWGFLSGFSEFEIEILFPARARFASRAIFGKFCLKFALPETKRIFAFFFIVIYSNRRQPQ